MKLLLAHVWRSALRIRFRLLAVSLVAACGFGIYVGVYSAIESVILEQRRQFREGNIADLDVRFAPEDQTLLPDFSDIEGIEQVEPRLVYPGRISLAEGESLTSLLVTVDPGVGGRINKVTLLEGKALDSADPEGVLIDRNLARYHGFKVGDRFELLMADEVYSLHIVGIGVSPEFLMAPANPKVFIPAKGSLGILFAHPALIEARVGIPMVNSLLFKFRGGGDGREIQRAVVERVEGALAYDVALPLSEQFGFRFLDLNIKAFKIFLPSLVVVFDLTAFLVTFFLSFQWIEQERQQIGALMALGYPKRKIAGAYLFATLIIAAVALLAGFVLAHFTARNFAVHFAGSLGFPAPDVVLDIGHARKGVFGLILVLAMASAWPQAWLLRLSPLEAVRDTGRSLEGRIGSFGALISALPGPVWFRYGVRNLIRNRALSLFTAAAVGMGLGVTVSFFIALTSSSQTSIRWTAKDPWQGLVDFFAPVGIRELDDFRAIPGVKDVAPYAKQAGVIVGPKGDGNIYMLGIPPGEGLRNPQILEGRTLERGDTDQVIVEKNLAEKLGIALNGRATIQVLGRRKEVTVVGLLSGALPGECYVPLALAQEVTDSSGTCSGMFLLTDGDPEAVRRALYAKGNISQVTLKTEIVEQILSTTGEKWVILRLGSLFSIGIAILFMFCSVSFTILHRKPEYLMLRIIGFSNRIVAGTVLAEVVVLGLGSVALAIPIGVGTATFLTARMSEAWFTVEVLAEAPDFLKVLIPGFFLMPFAAVSAIRGILREPLEKSLRERRCG
ncbi:MAG: hypothetical protein GHCLOJNM_02630 [bacterium]|nr:hypothetical protein [bacterium]